MDGLKEEEQQGEEEGVKGLAFVQDTVTGSFGRERKKTREKIH